jgi:O-acetyl-ADP-ribose deacetylase (regulator of RNase III)
MTTIRECRGNIFDSEMQTLVNPVNCRGVMGAGLALQFKERYPLYFDAYQFACKQGVLEKDKCFIYDVSEHRKIYSFPTKIHWRGNSTKKLLGEGLLHLTSSVDDYGITSLAVPALGCGLGGLKWEEVRPILYRWLNKLTIPVELYVP